MEGSDFRENPDNANADQPSKDEAQELVRTIEADARRKSAESQATHRRGRSPIWIWVLVLVVAANAYLWIGQPSWIVGGPTLEEGLRYRMFVQAQRIHAYQQQNGEAPDQLNQVGAPMGGLRYERTGPATWELIGEVRGTELRLPSNMRPADFYYDLGS